jgi:hypothetical protein
MPQQANITVKKADGITDVIYSSVQPASGGNPAVWRGPQGVAPAHKPELRVRSSSNKANTVRRIEGSLMYPQTVTGTDGTVTVANRITVGFNAAVPQGAPQTEINEAVAQAFNLFASSLNKSMVQEGFAAT